MKEHELDELRRKIAILYNKEIDPVDLGNIALEIIVKRNQLRDDMERNPTLDKKTEYQHNVSSLNELERVLVSLYSISRIKSGHKQPFNLINFTKPRYWLFDKKVSS